MKFRASELHPVVWITWIICCVVTVVMFDNPIYSVFVIGLCFALSASFAYSSQRQRMFSVVMLMIAFFSLFRIVLMLLTTHGIGHEFLTLPSVTVPQFLGGYQLGGTLELTILLQTLNESLLLAAIVACFALGGVVVSPAEWLSVMPRALFTPTLAVLIGVGAIPSLISSAQAAREADLARTGGVVRGKRTRRWKRLLMPVVDDSLERAVGLGETLETRSFGVSAVGSKQRLVAIYFTLLAASLLALLVGWNTMSVLFKSTLGIGIAVLIVLVAFSFRTEHRSLYRRRPLSLSDKYLIVFTVSCLAFAFFARQLASDISWDPSSLDAPNLALFATIAVLLFAWPLFRTNRQEKWA